MASHCDFGPRHSPYISMLSRNKFSFYLKDGKNHKLTNSIISKSNRVNFWTPSSHSSINQMAPENFLHKTNYRPGPRRHRDRASGCWDSVVQWEQTGTQATSRSQPYALCILQRLGLLVFEKEKPVPAFKPPKHGTESTYYCLLKNTGSIQAL